MAVEKPRLAKIVEPGGGESALRRGPVEAVGVQSRVLAIHGAAAALHRVEPRAAAARERRVRRLAAVVRIVAHSTVVLRQLAPFVIGRKPPSEAERPAGP